MVMKKYKPRKQTGVPKKEVIQTVNDMINELKTERCPKPYSVDVMDMKHRFQHASKLSADHKVIAIRMYAEFRPISLIVSYLKEKGGVEVTPGAIREVVLHKDSEVMLRKFRTDYIANIKDVPIANKRIRVEDLEVVRVKVMEQIQLLKCEDILERDELRKLTMVLVEIIKSTREEMERKPELLKSLVIEEFAEKTDDEIIARRNELLKEAEVLIIGAVGGGSVPTEGIEGTLTQEST